MADRATDRARSRSPLPPRDSRKRSRSPRRRDDRDKRGGGGFKWKEKRRETDDREGGEKRLERGYRNRSRSPRRDRPCENDSKPAPKGSSVEDKFGSSKSKSKQTPVAATMDSADIENGRPGLKNTVEDKFGVAAKFGPSSSSSKNSVEDKFGVAAKFGTDSTKNTKDESTKPTKSAPAPAPAPIQANGEPMIEVFVNDRLGTRVKVPCYASDTIKLFKAQVASMIGRHPREIMLKRQGQRPYKDQLSLEDYEISNGASVDLEIDTGE